MTDILVKNSISLDKDDVSPGRMAYLLMKVLRSFIKHYVSAGKRMTYLGTGSHYLVVTDDTEKEERVFINDNKCVCT